MHPLSVFIITKNEESDIRPCLESVRWADEIVVVDAESTDRTVAICREYTDRVFVRPWPGFARQKAFALSQCRNDWVLSLDADERVRPELASEIRELLQGDPAAEGYLIARRSYFLGKWIRRGGWYPGYQLRLFRKSRARVLTSRVHEGFAVEGRIEKLGHDIDHHSHPSLSDSLEKLNRYSTLEALDRLDRKRVYWYDFIIHPLSAFLIKYMGQKAFLDGMHGFLLSWVSAFLKMSMYMKLWRLQRMDETELKKVREETV